MEGGMLSDDGLERGREGRKGRGEKLSASGLVF